MQAPERFFGVNLLLRLLLHRRLWLSFGFWSACRRLEELFGVNLWPFIKSNLDFGRLDECSKSFFQQFGSPGLGQQFWLVHFLWIVNCVCMSVNVFRVREQLKFTEAWLKTRQKRNRGGREKTNISFANSFLLALCWRFVS